MTHLRIEQNNIQENVSSAVIEKLYELASSGDLDNTSNLAGNLYTTGTYQYYVDLLTTEFPDLTITASQYFAYFADPEVARIMTATYGNNGELYDSDLVGVPSLADRLFRDNTTIQTFNELSRYRSIVSLGSQCFKGCSNLQEISLNNITTLGSNDCFQDCSSLEEVTVNSSLNVIPLNCFFNCSNLEKINGLTGNITITYGAFRSCQKLEDSTFENCTIYLDENPTTGGYVFYNCNTITELNLAAGCSLGNQTFRGCTNLSDIDLSEVVSVSGGCFQSCSSLQHADLSSCIYINTNSLFNGCTSLQDIIINSNANLTTAAYAMCYGCSSLTSISGLEHVTYVDMEAFHNATSLTNISLGNVTTIKANAFAGCSNLETISMGNEIKQYNSTTGYIEVYWNSLTTLEGSALSGCNKLFSNNMTVGQDTGKVHLILNNITSIPWQALKGGMAALSIPNVTGIPSDFMTSAYNLEYVDISSATTIGANAFKNCNHLSEVVLSNNLETIGSSAFQSCSSLQGPFTIPASVTSIGGDVFRGCTGITCTIMQGTTPPTISWGYSVYYDAPIYVPDAALSAYQTAWDGVESNRPKNQLRAMSTYTQS